ncbi:hypothetical protein BGW38_002640, partial [Lunasporangiospora selenospora]
DRQQELPYECILVVIQEFKYDLTMLHRLLIVNRFFFEESLRLLMSHPLRKWSVIPYYMRPRKEDSRELFLTLILRSALQYEWLKRQGVDIRDPVTSARIWTRSIQNQSHGTDVMTDLDSIMKEYGLSLSYSPRNPKESYSQLTIVDYSAYFSSLSTRDLDQLDLGQIVKLEQPDDSGPLATDDTETDSEQEDSTCIRVARALAKFLIRHGCRHITDLGFDLHESAYYSRYAAIMPKLRTIKIDMTEHLEDRITHAYHAASLISLNQKEFPSKPCLELEFSHRGTIMARPRFNQDGIQTEEWLDGRRRCQTDFAPLKILYDAIGRPRSMDVSFLPWFYDEAQLIETDDLVSFVDRDIERWDAGEAPELEEFLRRCPKLRSIDMAVGHHRLFQWTSALSATPGQDDKLAASMDQQQPLAKLADLRLRSDRYYQILIQALNDIVGASGDSLETIRVGQELPGHYYPADDQEDAILRTTRELQSLPKATTLGIEWYLPRVREIELYFEGSVSIGSFDQCPLLETLTIESNKRVENFYSFLNSIDPVEVVQQAAFLESLTISSIWEIPSLKHLRLSGIVALQFNFESIRFMEQLQSLVMEVGKRGWFPNFANMYMQISPNDVQAALMLNLETPIGDAYRFLNSQEEALVALYSYQTLDPLDLFFDLDQMLEQTELSSSLLAAKFEQTLIEHISHDSLRFLESQDHYDGGLSQLRFLGSWKAVGPNTWTRILTEYAPNLIEFHGFDRVEPSTQIREIEEAFKIFKRLRTAQNRSCKDTEETADDIHQITGDRHIRRLGISLCGTFNEGSLSESELEELGLKGQIDHDDDRSDSSSELRVYQLMETSSSFSRDD